MLEKYSEELTKIIMMMGVNLLYAALCLILGLLFVKFAYGVVIKMIKKNIPNETEEGTVLSPIIHGAAIVGLCLLAGIIIGLACN